MAKDKGKGAADKPAEDNAAEVRVGPMHEAFAAYIKEHKGIDITPEQVFAVTSTRVAFRKTDAYRVGVVQAKENAREAALEAKATAAAEKAKEREAAKAAKEAEKAEKAKAAAAAKEKADAEKAAKASKDSGAALAEANAAKATPAKKTGKGKAKTEAPF